MRLDSKSGHTKNKGKINREIIVRGEDRMKKRVQ